MLVIFKTKEFLNSFVQPTKTHGQPNYIQIRRLERKLIPYAANIACSKRGYIGLIETAEEYTKLSNTPIVMPAKPAEIILDKNTIGHESFRLQQNYHREMDEFLKA